MSDQEIKNLFEAQNRTPRQRWGNTAIQKHFHQQGRDFEAQNWKKDLESIDVLLDAGYKPEEVEPIIKHFNAGVEYLRNKDHKIRHIFSYVIERQELPPLPPQNEIQETKPEETSEGLPAINRTNRPIPWPPRFFR